MQLSKRIVNITVAIGTEQIGSDDPIDKQCFLNQDELYLFNRGEMYHSYF
jgi:hypothetical protein